MSSTQNVEQDSGAAVAPTGVHCCAVEPRFPGAKAFVRMVSDPYDTVDEAQDVLTTVSALAGFVFGYVDEELRRTVTFHEDQFPNHPLPDDEGMSRVFSFVREA